MATGLAAFMVVVAIIVIGVVIVRSRHQREPVATVTPNEFLLAPPTSFPDFPNFPSVDDWALLATVRDEVDADPQVEPMADHEDWPLRDPAPGWTAPLVAPVLVGLPPATGETEPVRVELTELDTADLAELHLDTSPPDVIIDLTGSTPALELAARLSLPVVPGGPLPRRGAIAHDPTVAALIDRFQVKRAVARLGAVPLPRRRVRG